MNASPLPIKLKNPKVKVYWKQDINSSICALCHKHIMAATQDEIANQRIANKLMIGACGCGYHTDCINAWVKAGNKLCPVDNSTWTLKGTTSNTVIWNTLT